jgi:hypothetical protein
MSERGSGASESGEAWGRKAGCGSMEEALSMPHFPACRGQCWAGHAATGKGQEARGKRHGARVFEEGKWMMPDES